MFMLALLTGHYHLKGGIYILTLIDHDTCSRYKRKLNGLTSTLVLLICSRTKVGKQIITGYGASVVRCPLVSNLSYPEIIKYEGHLESKERFAIQRYLLIKGKKQNMQVLSHTFTYFSIVTLDIEALAVP
jgi:hypothetical protein